MDVPEVEHRELSGNLDGAVAAVIAERASRARMRQMDRFASDGILYHHLIYAKFDRAVPARAVDGFLLDARQSADVARKAIYRSIDAWLTIRNQLSTDTPDILEFLVHFNRLRREVEDPFPELTDPISHQPEDSIHSQMRGSDTFPCSPGNSFV